MRQMNKILVVNVNWMGDVIFSSPIFKALKTAYPQSSVSCLAVPRVKEVLERITDIDEVILYDEKGRHRNPLALIKLIYELRCKNFNIVFLLHRSLTRALLVFLTGIPERVGYDTKGRGIFLTHKVKPLKGVRHRSDYYLNVLESFGIRIDDRTTTLNASEAAQADLKTISGTHNIRDEDYLIIVHPGGNWDLKRWPPENVALLIDHLMADLHAKVIVTGASQDTALTNVITRFLKSDPIILTGRTNLKELMALMHRADLVISADSGPLHLANSLGTEVVGIFGPTRPEITGTRAKARSLILQHEVGCNKDSCYYLDCPDNICMQSVTVENVLDAVKQIQNK
jgi:heptosyltransferase II